MFGSEPPVVAKSNPGPPARPAQPPQVQTQPYPGHGQPAQPYPGYPPQPSTSYPGYPPTNGPPGHNQYQPPPYPPVTQPSHHHSPYPIQPPSYPPHPVTQPQPVQSQSTGNYKNDTIGDDIMLDSLRTAVGYVLIILTSPKYMSLVTA